MKFYFQTFFFQIGQIISAAIYKVILPGLQTFSSVDFAPFFLNLQIHTIHLPQSILRRYTINNIHNRRRGNFRIDFILIIIFPIFPCNRKNLNSPILKLQFWKVFCNPFAILRQCQINGITFGIGTCQCRQMEFYRKVLFRTFEPEFSAIGNFPESFILHSFSCCVFKIVLVLPVKLIRNLQHIPFVLCQFHFIGRNDEIFHFDHIINDRRSCRNCCIILCLGIAQFLRCFHCFRLYQFQMETSVKPCDFDLIHKISLLDRNIFLTGSGMFHNLSAFPCISKSWCKHFSF